MFVYCLLLSFSYKLFKICAILTFSFVCESRICKDVRVGSVSQNRSGESIKVSILIANLFYGNIIT